MPYIDRDDRARIKPLVQPLLNELQNGNGWVGLEADGARAGRVNYLLMAILLTVYPPGQIRYRDLNELMGVLSCVQHEYYRRWGVEYEEKKRWENGDVV